MIEIKDIIQCLSHKWKSKACINIRNEIHQKEFESMLDDIKLLLEDRANVEIILKEEIDLIFEYRTNIGENGAEPVNI